MISSIKACSLFFKFFHLILAAKHKWKNTSFNSCKNAYCLIESVFFPITTMILRIFMSSYCSGLLGCFVLILLALPFSVVTDVRSLSPLCPLPSNSTSACLSLEYLRRALIHENVAGKIEVSADFCRLMSHCQRKFWIWSTAEFNRIIPSN